MSPKDNVVAFGYAAKTLDKAARHLLKPGRQRKAPRPWPRAGEPWSMGDSIRVLEHVERLWGRVPPKEREFVRLGISRTIAQVDLEERAGRA